MTTDVRGKYTKAGFGATALLASPRDAHGTKISGKFRYWATGAVAVAIALAGAACSPSGEGSGSNTEPTKASQMAAAQTLPGRVNNAMQLVEILIRDDLYNEPAHRDDYETAMLSNELKQNEDWGVLSGYPRQVENRPTLPEIRQPRPPKRTPRRRGSGEGWAC